MNEEDRALLCKNIELHLHLIDGIVWLPNEKNICLKKYSGDLNRLRRIYREFDLSCRESDLNECLEFMKNDLYIDD